MERGSVRGEQSGTAVTDAAALCIVGAGGVGREALDVALATGIDVVAFLDDHRAGQIVRRLPVLLPADAPAGSGYLLGMADPGARRRLADLLSGHRPVTLAHPRSTVAPDTEVGAGALLMAGAYVSSGVTLGRHTQIQYNATVGHDAELGDYAVVLPGAHVSGGVALGEGVTVGTGACVLQGLSVGADAFVGAGAVVTRDVPAGVVVTGVPARSHPR